MAKKKKNDAELPPHYQKRGIQPITGSAPSIDQLIAEGNLLLEADSKQSPQQPSSTTKTSPPPKSKDYYRQARLQLFKGMDPKKVNMLQRMEKEHDVNNDIYQCFVDEVIKLGDKISDQ